MNRPDAVRWLERARALALHPRLPDAAAALLAALIGWQLAAVTWAALPPTPAAAPPEVRPVQATGEASGGEGPGPGTRLARLHLFGEPAAGDEAPGADSGAAETDAPETQLNLTLKGVYAAGDGEGIAIITAGGGPEKVYTVGDTIAGNARIAGIFGDRVVLRRNGRAETLRLDLAEDEAVAGGSGGESGPATDAVERAARLRERLLDNPLELARMVRFQPYRRDGELVGYRIKGRSGEADLLGDLGIRPSDVITRINGIPLNNPANGNRALQELRDARMINVTILRDGSRRQLAIPIGEAG